MGSDNRGSFALCCRCGSVRTARVSRMGTYRPPAWDYRDRTCHLKCQQCGKATRHALCLSDADHRDWQRATGGREHDP